MLQLSVYSYGSMSCCMPPSWITSASMPGAGWLSSQNAAQTSYKCPGAVQHGLVTTIRVAEPFGKLHCAFHQQQHAKQGQNCHGA